jgi:hypothetical protein
MIYLKEENTGVTVEDVGGDSADLCVSWPGHPDMGLDPVEADAVLRGLLEWRRIQIDPEETNDNAALYIDIKELIGRLMARGGR